MVLMGRELQEGMMVQLESKEGTAIGRHVSLEAIAGLPTLACEGPLAEQAVVALRKVACLVVTTFAEAIDINAIKFHAQIHDFSTKSVGDMVELFIDPARMAKSQNDATKKFMQGGLAELQGNAAKAMMEKIFHLSATKQVDLEIGIVKVPIEGVGVDEVLAMVTVLDFVHNIASAMLVARSEMKVPSKCIVNHVCREDLRKCISDGILQCDEGLASMETHTNILLAAESTGAVWAMSIHNAKTWMKGCRAVLMQVEVAMFSQCARDLQMLAQLVEKHCPKYSHFCNDSTFSTALAKKHLLGHAFKDSLAQEAGALFRSIAQLVQIAIDFGLPPPDKNKLSADIIERANLTYASAKEAVLCTAAANVIISFTGEQRNSIARDLVASKGPMLPKALLAALKEFADKAPAAHPAVKVEKAKSAKIAAK